jgi:uncharacterized membrane protein YfcA
MQGFISDIAFALIAILTMIYFIIIRVKRKGILEKYEPESAAYAWTEKLTNPLFLIASIIASVFSVGGLVVNSRDNAVYVDKIRSDPTMFILIAVFTVAIFLFTFNMYRKK